MYHLAPVLWYAYVNIIIIIINTHTRAHTHSGRGGRSSYVICEAAHSLVRQHTSPDYITSSAVAQCAWPVSTSVRPKTPTPPSVRAHQTATTNKNNNNYPMSSIKRARTTFARHVKLPHGHDGWSWICCHVIGRSLLLCKYEKVVFLLLREFGHMHQRANGLSHSARTRSSQDYGNNRTTTATVNPLQDKFCSNRKILKNMESYFNTMHRTLFKNIFSNTYKYIDSAADITIIKVESIIDDDENKSNQRTAPYPA